MKIDIVNSEYYISFSKREALDLITTLSKSMSDLSGVTFSSRDNNTRVTIGVDPIESVIVKAVEFLSVHIDQFDSYTREQVLLSISSGVSSLIWDKYRKCFMELEGKKLENKDIDINEWSSKWRI